MASLLRAAGHQVAFFDAMLASGLADYHAKLKPRALQSSMVYGSGFTLTRCVRAHARRLLRDDRERAVRQRPLRRGL